VKEKKDQEIEEALIKCFKTSNKIFLVLWIKIQVQTQEKIHIRINLWT
jgi:hypothetical protein